MNLVGALFLLLALALAAYGVHVGHARWRHEAFLRSGRAVSVKGTCVNLRWTNGGLVASGISYVDKGGSRRLVWMQPHRTIPVPVGERVSVRYDPDGKTNPLVNGVAAGIGSYGLAAVCLVLSVVFLFNGIRQF
ncbi:DUF3592 domain-containing protein [Streptomyces sp. NPDC048109]|uniref:DUF3592 domain-containing protein n=1 Tax=Streptomyces sp. NPDC048109 TaxID=3155482 RepID=UPI003433DDBF